MTDFLINWAMGDLATWLFSHIVGSIVASGAFVLASRYAFNQVKQRNELVLLFACTFVIAFLASISLDRQRPHPNLVPHIEQVMYGGKERINENSDAIDNQSAFFIISVLNAGQAQSVGRNITVSASIDGATYVGKISIMPEKSKMTLASRSITFYKDDDLLVKMSSPIPVGGQVVGTLLVSFSDAPADIFSSRSPTFTVSVCDFNNNRTSDSTHPQDRSVGMQYFPTLHEDLE